MFKKNKILIVEDDIFVARMIKYELETHNLDVINITSSHDETLDFLQNNKVELILMDININGPIDGIQSCDIIYLKYKVPVIFISSFYDKEVIFLIQESFAKGYLIKPFRNEELLMLIFFLLKPASNDICNIDFKKTTLKNDFVFCIDKQILLHQNNEMKLTYKEKKLMQILCKNKNAYVSYENIFDYVWGKQKICINKIRGTIFRLKNKLPYLSINNNQEHGYKIE
ncbi:two-component system response regulator [Arcobacter venerupis]|uniref:Two-component system response regulator n=1 Tax=Arcobacter venerupis TaxID=1054033 RepID=A0AAE7BB37_9BACT|nr:response regulator [Arcobacter venerupis]QKF68521.1 two-component system response regulator [Arcobacter venerupis]RWS48193.1 hypothetical protein CKA56_15390 [Arcobacter venerupis]